MNSSSQSTKAGYLHGIELRRKSYFLLIVLVVHSFLNEVPSLYNEGVEDCLDHLDQTNTAEKDDQGRAMDIVMQEEAYNQQQAEVGRDKAKAIPSEVLLLSFKYGVILWSELDVLHYVWHVWVRDLSYSVSIAGLMEQPHLLVLVLSLLHLHSSLLLYQFNVLLVHCVHAPPDSHGKHYGLYCWVYNLADLNS